MRLSQLALLAPLVPTVLSRSLSEHELPRSLHKREYVKEPKSAYDYIIVGGGMAGLVLAARLTENGKYSVLVMEAGGSGDAVADRINSPSGAYYSSLLYTEYDWQYKTVPQPNAGNRVFDWPRGKVLGGSSAVNAMYLVRPSVGEVDAWASMVADQDGDAAKRWSWEKFYPTMKSTETFTPPREDVAQVGNFTYSADTHGTSGPMQASYPAAMMSQIGTWIPTFENIGIPATTEINGGKTLGAMVGPSWINPSNLTRSYAKSAYLDPAIGRSNLDVLVGATATQIIWGNEKVDDEYEAIALQFVYTSDGRDGPFRSVQVKKEMILAGGVVGSPQLLMVSGVGPKDALQNAGVSVKVELPGVGAHVQDHLTAAVVWNSASETAGDINASGSDFSRTTEFKSFINSATAWANLTAIFGEQSAQQFQQAISAAATNSSQTLVPVNSTSEVVEGYKKIYSVIADNFLKSDIAVVEFLISLVSPGSVSMQAAIQHPLSQGRLYINTSSVFDQPIIDPNYFSHWADVTVMRQSLKLIRTFGATYPFNETIGAEVSPGPGVSTDEAIDAWIINSGSSSQYHPISTCAMLPKSEGGVVDANLRVYGLSNVRVVDSSVYPFLFASHVGASTYGLAEAASDFILEEGPNVWVHNVASGLKTTSGLGFLWTSIAVLVISQLI